MDPLGVHLDRIIAAAVICAACYACAHDAGDPTAANTSATRGGGTTKEAPSPSEDTNGDPRGEGAPAPGGDPQPGAPPGSGSAPPPTCIDPAASLSNGHHNAGQDCLSCHRTISSA